MKKLFFLILFLSVNIIAFGSNVYFLNGGSGYVYTNGQTFYSNQDGSAPVSYWIWADPARYNYSNCGAKFQDPDGNWSDWSDFGSGSQGTHHCLKAGTWHIKGRVWVNRDFWGYTNYWMETDFTLTFYVVDNLAPSTPQNLSCQSSNNHPVINWTANTEDDLSEYKIYRKLGSTYDWTYLATATTSSYVDVSQNLPTDENHTIWYKVKACDINSNESEFSSSLAVSVAGNALDKKNLAWNLSENIYRLDNNYPNPFNPTTTIAYNIPESEYVILKVFNTIGQEVTELVNSHKEHGYYAVTFDAGNLPSGIYFYKLTAGNYSETKKMLLTK